MRNRKEHPESDKWHVHKTKTKQQPSYLMMKIEMYSPLRSGDPNLSLSTYHTAAAVLQYSKHTQHRTLH